MKSIYKFFVVILIGLHLSSCGDLDVNDNPNFPTTVTPELLLPSGILWTTSQLGSDVQLIGGLWSQHYAQSNNSNQYTNFDSYNITNANFPRVWLSMYAGALPDLLKSQEIAEANSQWGYWIIAQTMMAFDYHILVDLYGTIPFSEALKDDISAPKYDDGKAVNKGIIEMLDAAIAKKADAVGKASLKEKDLVFGGDINKWVQFAKTLKLKILLRDFEANKVAIQTLLTEGDFLMVDAKMGGFVDKENNSNPLYENDRRKLNTANNIRASATMIAYLEANEDPRISAYFETSINDDYRGLPQGGYTIEQTTIPAASLSRARLAAEDPVYLLSAADSYFIQAECYARLGNKANAKSAYEKGLTAAFARWELVTEGSELLAGVYKFDDSSLDTMIKTIIMQKWVSSVRCNAWDSFFDINRTGYPKLGTEFTVLPNDWITKNPNYIIGTLTPSVNSVIASGTFPRRLLITKNSQDNNPNAPALIPLTEKMWWHQ